MNNALPESRHIFRAVYMVYALGSVITTFVFTFSRSCTFAIEVEILHCAYWGGFVCVFASSPSYTRLKAHTKWVGLDRTFAINLIFHAFMFYHEIFFWLAGYGLAFARMPCGTFHPLLVLVLDPSRFFWFLSDLLTALSLPAILPLSLLPLIVTFLLASEIKNSIRDSPNYQLLVDCFYRPTVTRPGVTTVDNALENPKSWISHNATNMYGFIDKIYRQLRRVFGLPSHARGGIRLVTALDIQHRRSVALFTIYEY